MRDTHAGMKTTAGEFDVVMQHLGATLDELHIPQPEQDELVELQEKLKLGGDGGGVFDLDSRGAVMLTVKRVTTAGPPAAEVADALAGRSLVAAALGDLPANSRTALSHLADFFNTPVEQSPT
jgi:hypothetical protein